MTLSRTMMARLTERSTVALVLIDVQNDYCHPEGKNALAGFDVSKMVEMTDRLARVLAAARSLGMAVVHVQQTAPEDEMMAPAWQHFIGRRMEAAGKVYGVDVPVTVVSGTWGHATVDALAPAGEEAVVRKTRSSAFFETSLDEILRGQGVETVLVAGVMSDGCVDSTMRSAVHRDYFVCLVEDGVEGYDPEIVRASLAISRHRYDTVRADEIVELLSAPATAAPA